MTSQHFFLTDKLLMVYVIFFLADSRSIECARAFSTTTTTHHSQSPKSLMKWIHKNTQPYMLHSFSLSDDISELAHEEGEDARQQFGKTPKGMQKELASYCNSIDADLNASYIPIDNSDINGIIDPERDSFLRNAWDEFQISSGIPNEGQLTVESISTAILRDELEQQFMLGVVDQNEIEADMKTIKEYLSEKEATKLPSPITQLKRIATEEMSKRMAIESKLADTISIMQLLETNHINEIQHMRKEAPQMFDTQRTSETEQRENLKQKDTGQKRASRLHEIEKEERIEQSDTHVVNEQMLKDKVIAEKLEEREQEKIRMNQWAKESNGKFEIANDDPAYYLYLKWMSEEVNEEQSKESHMDHDDERIQQIIKQVKQSLGAHSRPIDTISTIKGVTNRGRDSTIEQQENDDTTKIGANDNDSNNDLNEVTKMIEVEPQSYESNRVQQLKDLYVSQKLREKRFKEKGYASRAVENTRREPKLSQLSHEHENMEHVVKEKEEEQKCIEEDRKEFVKQKLYEEQMILLDEDESRRITKLNQENIKEKNYVEDTVQDGNIDHAKDKSRNHNQDILSNGAALNEIASYAQEQDGDVNDVLYIKKKSRKKMLKDEFIASKMKEKNHDSNVVICSIGNASTSAEFDRAQNIEENQKEEEQEGWSLELIQSDETRELQEHEQTRFDKIKFEDEERWAKLSHEKEERRKKDEMKRIDILIQDAKAKALLEEHKLTMALKAEDGCLQTEIRGKDEMIRKTNELMMSIQEKVKLDKKNEKHSTVTTLPVKPKTFKVMNRIVDVRSKDYVSLPNDHINDIKKARDNRLSNASESGLFRIQSRTSNLLKRIANSTLRLVHDDQYEEQIIDNQSDENKSFIKTRKSSRRSRLFIKPTPFQYGEFKKLKSFTKLSKHNENGRAPSGNKKTILFSVGALVLLRIISIMF